jgi:hypothetical protein
MTYLFNQIYLDDIKNLKHLSETELMEAVTTEFILNESYDDGKKVMEKKLQDNTIYKMDRQKLWLLIIEAFKLMDFEKPSNELQSLYEKTLNLPRSKQQNINSNINRTITFENLIHYLTCIYKLKYM